MTRFLFLSWPGAGNQVPEIGLAAELVGRGHQVSFAGYQAQRERFEKLGFGFRVLQRAEQDWPTEPPEDWMPVLAGTVWASAAHLQDLPEAVAAERPDLLVIDCLMFGALAAAERLSMPTAVLVHSAPGALAPPGGAMDLSLLAAINAVRDRAGLVPVERAWDAWLRFPTLCTSVAALDPAADVVPEEFRWVGPIAEPASSSWQSPWPASDRRPLVVVGFSTGVAWDQTSRIERTLAALGGGEYRLLITTGAADASVLRVPDDVVVLPYVSHRAVLPQADVVISHAGHGTVAAALTHGLPMVSLPNLAADQPALAQHLGTLGAGIALDGDRATAAQIAAAVAEVQGGSYRDSAAGLARLIKGAPGAGGAASMIEGLAS